MKKLQTKDAAKLLDVTPARVNQLENEGRLRAERTESGTRLFERKDVEKLAKERAEQKKNR